MNWGAIASGEHPNNLAFGALPPARRVSTLHQGLEWINGHPGNPRERWRVCVAILHFMDAFGIDDEWVRVACSVKVGHAALTLGEIDTAIHYLRHVLSRPTSPETGLLHVEAKINLGTALLNSNPREAARLLSMAMDAVEEGGDKDLMAQICVSLGAAYRKIKDFHRARSTYERGIKEAKYGWDHALRARLHGNLGNVLTDDLALHNEAISHYEEAVASFQLAGQPQSAAARLFHLISAAFHAGRFDLALRLLQTHTLWAVTAPDAFSAVIEEMRWNDAPLHSALQFVEVFTSILNSEGSMLTAETRVLIRAASAILDSKRGNTEPIISLFQKQSVLLLRNSALRDALTEELIGITESVGRPGLSWLVPWLIEHVPAKSRSSLKRTYNEECATEWLSSIVRGVVSGHLSEADVLKSAQGGGLPFGLAAVSTDPPSWAGLTSSAAKQVFRRLRIALCPSLDEVKDDLVRVFDEEHRLTQHRDYEALVPLMRHYGSLADLLGEPELQVSARCFVYQFLCEQNGGITRWRFEESKRLLHEASEIAEGIPREEVRVATNRSLLLKEAQFANENERFAEAIAQMRKALAIARREDLSDALPSLFVNFANTLVSNPLRTGADLVEAESMLSEGILLIETIAFEDSSILSTLHNSLAVALSELADFENAPHRLTQSCIHFEKALSLRKAEGNPDRIVVTLMSLLGTRVKLQRRNAMESNAVEISRLINEIRLEVSLVKDNVKRSKSLLNAMIALAEFEQEEALVLGREAIEAAREPEPTRAYIEACLSLGETALRFTNYSQGLVCFQDGIDTLRRFRALGGESRYRASLSASFASLYRGKFAAQTHLAAVDEDRWWTIDEAAAPTILEDAYQGSVVLKKQEVLAALAELPSNTLVVQVFQSSRHGFAVAILRQRQGRIHVRIKNISLGVDEVVRANSGAVEGDGFSIPIYDPRLPEQFSAQLKWFGRTMIEPALSGENLHETRRIVMVVESWLRDIAWHAIPLSGNGAVLGDLMELTEVPSVTILSKLLTKAERKLQRAVLVACDPHRILTQHLGEVQSAFSTLDVPDKLVLSDRSQPMLKAQILTAIGSADLAHFAGHSHHSPGHPEESGLLASDGLLSIDEIGVALGRRGPAIVVLSSCESAKTASDGHGDLLSLSTVFLQAGAQAVIGAGWPVPDYVASETTRVFYGHLKAYDPIRALTQTRRSLKSHNVVGQFWPSFRILGWSRQR